MKIKPVLPSLREGESTPCHAFAISVIANISFEKAKKAVIKRCRETTGISELPYGLSLEDMQVILGKLGFHIKWNYTEYAYEWSNGEWLLKPYGYYDTLAIFGNKRRYHKDVYLICSSIHYMVVHKGLAYECDSSNPIPASKAEWANSKLWAWSRVSAVEK